jgi:hypothetical protein
MDPRNMAGAEMADQGISKILSDLDPADLSVDEEGRVTIADPEIAERLRAVVGRAPREGVNTNCGGCNAVAGCMTNIVRGCGRRAAAA